MINYSVQADVIDISNNPPIPHGIFFVDTCVWFWTTYTKANLSDQKPQSYQLRYYPNYLSEAIKHSATLQKCNLSFSELAARIEHVEYEIFKKSQPNDIRFKEFRHNFPDVRKNTVEEIETAWEQVKSMASPLDVHITKVMTDTAPAKLKTIAVDGTDFFYLKAMESRGIVQIITDDGDFGNVSGIRVFTANRALIQAARTQNKLINP